MGAKTMGSQGSGNGVQQHNNTWMTKEGSLYSLTLNEVEHQLSHLEKPLGSMNLDELLKTVWSAEATTQGKPRSAAAAASSSSVQWRPEFVVSSDLSNKTVDEVWRSIQHKRRKNEQIMKVDESQRKQQPVFGEMTLEEFLDKAGIVSRQTGDNLDSFDEFCPRSNWMQYELTPVEHTQACQQQLTHRKKGVGSGEVVEKTVERRQKRMIKNRESAARSRARKQAYTNELENKISILEEEIELLKKQHAAEKEVQCAPPPEPKFQLRRTNSGPL